jgi:hypothetical protein
MWTVPHFQKICYLPLRHDFVLGSGDETATYTYATIWPHKHTEWVTRRYVTTTVTALISKQCLLMTRQTKANAYHESCFWCAYWLDGYDAGRFIGQNCANTKKMSENYFISRTSDPQLARLNSFHWISGDDPLHEEADKKEILITIFCTRNPQFGFPVHALFTQVKGRHWPVISSHPTSLTTLSSKLGIHGWRLINPLKMSLSLNIWERHQNRINKEIKTYYILGTLPTYMLVVLTNYSQYKPAFVVRHLWLFCTRFIYLERVNCIPTYSR